MKRQKAEQKVSTEAARKAEEESAMAERRKLEQEFQKNWEESRQGRVNSWLGFTKGKVYTGDEPKAAAPAQKNPTGAASMRAPVTPMGAMGSAMGAAGSAGAAGGGPEKKKKKKEKFSPMGFRPPKHKPESR